MPISSLDNFPTKILRVMLTLRIQTQVLKFVPIAQAIWVQDGHLGAFDAGPAFPSRDLLMDGVKTPSPPPHRQDRHHLHGNCFPVGHRHVLHSPRCFHFASSTIGTKTVWCGLELFTDEREFGLILLFIFLLQFHPTLFIF